MWISLLPCIPPPGHRPGGIGTTPDCPRADRGIGVGLVVSGPSKPGIGVCFVVSGPPVRGIGRISPRPAVAGPSGPGRVRAGQDGSGRIRTDQGLKISATAETETPSSRPSKPRCSVVVALTDTRSVSIPIAAAIAARMASM